MTFKNKEQLLRESLMMSDVELGKVSHRDHKVPGSEIRSMVFMPAGSLV